MTVKELKQLLSQYPDDLRIDAAEWPALREAIDMMVSKCRG